jgi:hypothetical protein
MSHSSTANLTESGRETLPAFRKDAALNRLAERFNVAQFVSFGPTSDGPAQQFCRVSECAPNQPFDTIEEAIGHLFARSPEGLLNVRSFSEHQSQSREFLYGLSSPSQAIAAVRRVSAEGSFSIVNETVDVSDGGVSGVAMGGAVEFRPDDTPRGVERPGFAALPLEWAQVLLGAVYGFVVDLEEAKNGRLEFSVHPRPRGWKRTHMLYWEFEPSETSISASAAADWPNDFSRMIGDKVYGLLIARCIGAPVPFTTVINRRVAPFSFGSPTGSHEHWTRTSPHEQVPGKFTTTRGWSDPFRLTAMEDPEHEWIASVVSQEAVPALWSGACLASVDGQLHIEGVKGAGSAFMQGTASPAKLPQAVRAAVHFSYSQLANALGPVRFEWAYDGAQAWILQLHRGASTSTSAAVVPGDPIAWTLFVVDEGLEALRALVGQLPARHGILFDRPIGLTSHLADVVRKAGVPARTIDA